MGEMGTNEMRFSSFQETAWEVITASPAPWVGKDEGGILVAVSDGDQTVFLQESRTEQLSTGHTPGTNAVQPR